MYAVLGVAGKQHPVRLGDVFKVSRSNDDSYVVGEIVNIDNILLLVDDSSSVVESSGKVARCKVVACTRDKKVYAFKKRRRKNSRRIRGHRQNIAVLKFSELV